MAHEHLSKGDKPTQFLPVQRGNTLIVLAQMRKARRVAVNETRLILHETFRSQEEGQRREDFQRAFARYITGALLAAAAREPHCHA